MTVAVKTHSLWRRFAGVWALRDCTLALPQGCLAAVVGPNGAGKTTLLHMVVGLLPPSEGELTVFGQRPENTTAFLARVGFVGQDAPLYRQFSAADLLRLGRHLNPRWDGALAQGRLEAAGVPLDRPAARLSGGQRAQLALALAVGKRPDLLVLDEPLASLDPLARREFLQSLMTTVAQGTTVMMSSHLISDLERVCDFLIIIANGRLRLAGGLDDVIDQ
ncbi:MAG: ABC transporter ATP-binding protein, partial [Acidimicrobiales bacterium]